MLEDAMENLPARIQANDLWRLDGTVSRTRYLSIGCVLFAVKFVIDWAISLFVFHRHWTPLDYFMPGNALNVLSDSPALRAYYATMVTIALPFIWTGVALTLRRLRSANLPVWLVKLFFVPVVNLLLFFMLAILPPRESEENVITMHRATEPEPSLPVEANKKPASGLKTNEQAYPAAVGPIKQPEFDMPGALTAIFLPLPPAYALIYLGTTILKSYGWGLFVGIPFALGMSAAVLYGRRKQRKWLECFAIAMVSLVGLSGVLFIYGTEGAVCLAMTAPIAAAIAAMGATLGWAIQRRPTRPGENTLIRLSIFLFLPFLMGAEYAFTPSVPTFCVRSAIEIKAPPAVVWQNVISFSKLPPPKEWFFKTGIAYPIRAVIYGHGVGAVRHCIFSTGPFVEPINVWEERRLLRFSVTSQPQPMFEWSAGRNIDPPHLNGFLTSRQGQFLLTELPGGVTRLEGSTWYQHHMWPAGYWRIWSDAIIHRIHMRVLEHIKNLSEKHVYSSR